MRSFKKSWNGHSFRKWYNKNKGSLKILLSGLFGLIAITFQSNLIIMLLFGGTAAIGTKLLLDSLDFYFSDIDLLEVGK